MRSSITFVLLCFFAAVASSACTDKLACMKCLISDAVTDAQTAAKYNAATDPCQWPGVGCDGSGNVTSIALDGLPLSALFTSCIPDTTLRLTAIATNLANAVSWRGHPNIQYADFSGNGFQCVVSDPSLLNAPVGCLGFLGTFPSLQTTIFNRMTFSGGFSMSLLGFQRLATVVADAGTSVKQVVIRNCPALLTLRLRGASGFAAVSDQTTVAGTPAAMLAGTPVIAGVVVQSAASLTNFSCVECPLVSAFLSAAELTSISVSGAKFGTILATKSTLSSPQLQTLLTGTPQLNATPGLWIAGSSLVKYLAVTSSGVNCFDVGGLASLLSFDFSNNNISGTITTAPPAFSPVLNRQCPTAGPAQVNYVSSVMIQEAIAPKNALVSFAKDSQYATLRKLILSNNALQAVYVCGQPLSYVDVAFNPKLVGEVGSRRAPIATVGYVNATGSCCGGASTFSSTVGNEAAVACGCPWSTAASPPADFVSCLTASPFALDQCTATAPLYDPNLNPNANPNAIFGSQTTLTARMSSSLAGVVEMVLSGMSVTLNTFPILAPTGTIRVGNDALLTNETLRYTLAAWTTSFTFKNRFDNGLPDTYRPNAPWICTLDATSCSFQCVYRVDLNNLRNDSFVTATQTGNVISLVTDLTLVEVLPVLLNDPTFNHQVAIRLGLTFKTTLEPVVQTGCGMTLRGNIDATNVNNLYLAIVNYYNITPTHIVSATVGADQTPANFFESRCALYVPSTPYLPEGLLCTGGAFAQIANVKATVNIVTVTNGVQSLCAYPVQSQFQAPIFTSVSLGPNDNVTKPPPPSGTFSSSCGNSPAAEGAVFVYTVSVARTSRVRITLSGNGTTVDITDVNVFKCVQRFDSTQKQMVVSFQPTAGVNKYRSLYGGPSITATATVDSSSRRQTTGTSTAGDRIVFALDPSLSSKLALEDGATTTRAPPTPTQPNTTNASTTTTTTVAATTTTAPTTPPLTASLTAPRFCGSSATGEGTAMPMNSTAAPVGSCVDSGSSRGEVAIPVTVIAVIVVVIVIVAVVVYVKRSKHVSSGSNDNGRGNTNQQGQQMTAIGTQAPPASAKLGGPARPCSVI